MHKPLDQPNLTRLGAWYHIAYAHLKAGNATEYDFRAVVTAITLAEILCERGYGEEFIAEIELANAGLVRCRQWHERIGKYSLDGDAVQALEAALGIHDGQCKIALQIDLQDALKENNRRMSRAQADGVAV